MKSLSVLKLKAVATILASILSTIFFLGCKKENPDIKPIDTSTYHVVNTGSVFDDELKKYKAVCWLDEKIYPLESLSGEEDGAYGIGIHKTNIYVAGFYVENDIMHPCYWYNGKQNKLKLQDSNYWRATALDIIFFNGKLYVLGSINLVPSILIVDGDKIISTITLKNLPNSVAEELRGSNRFCLSGNKLYLGAAHLIEEQNGNFSYEVGYWTVNDQAAVTYTSLAANMSFARVYSIAVHQNQVAISGETINANGQNIPIIWSSKGVFKLAGKLNPSTQRIGGLTVDAEGTLYAMVSNATFSPQLAKLNMNNLDAFNSSAPPIPQEAKGNIKALDYSGKFAYSCAYMLQNRYFAMYWLDQKPVELEVPQKYYSYLNLTGTKVFYTQGTQN